MSYCKRCRHEECHNLFGDFSCTTTCKTCCEQEEMKTTAQKKTLSVTDVNEEATVFMIRKRNPILTKGLIEFISLLQQRAYGNENKKEKQQKKEVKKKRK